ncbi:LexA family protein [Henriciella aquimarina]|uniref:LexA family protein n=1 Tax=Henriciella aquimarina TaxID=545261 RepID=UPI001301A658|nr:XRE family transcriptional regulator [Henriciella aquimarina]
MDTEGKWPNGLTALIERRGINQAELARALNTSRQNVGRWVKQTRKIPLDVAEKIAEHLKVPVSEVLYTDGGGVVSAPLISWVSASRLTEMSIDQVEDAPRVTAPDLSASGEWIALRVQGDSMDRISPPESIIFVNLREKALVPNACYVIADEDGNATYKRYRPDPQRFEPVSVNDAHQPIFVREDQSPSVLGRVRKSILSL